MSKKISLVLEGGGMRGAYTAGCLSWLLDEGIEFDNAYGISTGAVHLISFLLKRKDFLYDMSTHWIADKSILGLRAILRCGHLVDYDHLFKHIIEDTLHYDICDAKDIRTDAYVGIYDVNKGLTEYHKVKEMDNELLKAATSLPILGKKVVRDDHVYLDGGITEMIPIHPAVKDECDAHLVITTKPIDYVRKPAKNIVVKFMGLCYPQCDHQIAKDYKIRHINYNDQIAQINQLAKEGKAFYRYPSENVPVSRLKGDEASLRKLFELGRQDMENSRAEIMALLK